MLKNYFSRAFSLFFIFGFLFIPLTFWGSGFQYQVTRWIFVKPIALIESHYFPYALKNIDLSSDTIGLNILICLLLLLALAITGLLDAFKVRSSWFVPVTRSVSAYYIAAILLRYGIDKAFKLQFYLPEPNILYSNFGTLTKDTLFWSTIGLSHGYNMVTGSVEVLTALLILLKPTRLLGFCIALGVFANILLINFSFDISVKTLVTFLLAVVIFNVYPYLATIYSFFVQKKQVQLRLQPQIKTSKWVHIMLSAGLIGYTLFPYAASGNFNDDNAKRPFLHGAYNIEQFIISGDTLQRYAFPYKRIFIHRDNYLILQQQDDQMVDYHFEPDTLKKQMLLQDYSQNKIIVIYNYDSKTQSLQLLFSNKQRWVIRGKALNWRAMPALRGNMHYTIDEVK